MDNVKKLLCGCCAEPQEEPVSPIPPPPPPPVVKKEDIYLDSEDPVKAIMESPQIQGLTLASVEFFLNDERQVAKQYSTGNDEEAKEFRKAIALAKRQNPDACTTLMKELLQLLPQKKSYIKQNSKLVSSKPSNPYISQMGSSKTNGFSYQRKLSNKVHNGTLNSTAGSQSSRPPGAKTIETSSVSVHPKQADTTSDSLQKLEPEGTKISTLELLEINTEANKTASFIETKKRRDGVLKRIEEEMSGQGSAIVKKPSNTKLKPGTLEPIKNPPIKIVDPQVEQEQEQFKNKFDELMASEEDEHLKIVKAFVFLYTSPYIYRDLNKRFTQKRYESYTKIVAFVMESLRKLPEEKVKDFKLPFTTGFSMYRGLKSTQLGKLNRGYWKAFTSCTLKKSIAEEFASRETGGCLLEIQFKPPVQHMYIRVPNSTQFTFYDESEVILFPFFPYEVLERSKDKSKCVLREVKQLEEDYPKLEQFD